MKQFIQKYWTAENVFCVLTVIVFYLMGIWR